MRADRLVSILLMLQRRQQVTASEVADELEISERTARRDLDALAAAGVPVYSQQGRGGGWRLAGGGRIDLSGLSASEARALFLTAGSSSNATAELRSALRKVVRALPESMRDRAEAAASAVVVDPQAWDRTNAGPVRPPLLDDIESAVVDGECLRLGYLAPQGEATERVVHPLGLAAKSRWWYLLADTEAGLRTFRVDRVTSAVRTGGPVQRPEGFELSAEWARIVERVDEMRAPQRAHATASTDALVHLRHIFGTDLAVLGGETRSEARPINVEVRGSSIRGLAADLAGFGGMVEVTHPPELRETLEKLGQELVATYATSSRQQI